MIVRSSSVGIQSSSKEGPYVEQWVRSIDQYSISRYLQTFLVFRDILLPNYIYRNVVYTPSPGDETYHMKLQIKQVHETRSEPKSQ